MFLTTLKGVLAHKARLLTTALAVVLGVAFMSGTLVLTDTLDQQFGGLVTDVNAGTDAYVRSPASVSASGMTDRGRVDAELVGSIRAVDGVDAAAGRIEGWAQVVGRDGETVGGGQAPTFGQNWIDDDRLRPYELAAGRPPAGDGEVAIDRGTANEAELAVGDRTSVLTQAGPVEVEVSGIVTYGGADSMLGATSVLFTDQAAQRLVGVPGQYDGIAAVAADGVSEAELARRIDATLGEGAEVLTGTELTDESRDDVAEDLAFFNALMLTFAVISLVVGAFIISNTFSIIVAQRGRELAVLRALGASRRQVMTSVLVESAVVGVLASVIGLGAGVGVATVLRGALSGLGLDLPEGSLVVLGGSMLTAFLVGVTVTMASALLPARRAARIAPVAAMRDVAVDGAARSRRRAVIGAVVFTLGAAALVTGLITRSDASLVLVAAGAALLFVAVTVLGPVLAAPLTRVIGAPIAAVRDVTGGLARQNAGRSPKRTASTASALMIGVALVSFLSIMGSSVKASLSDAIDGGLRSELVVSSEGMGLGSLDPTVPERIRALPEVDAAVGVRVAPATVVDEGRTLAGIDTAAADQVLDLDVRQGDLSSVGHDGLAVSVETAEEQGWELGSTVPVTFADGVENATEVRAIYANEDIGGGILVDHALLDAHGAQPLLLDVLVKLADGVDTAKAEATLAQKLEDVPTAAVLDRDAYIGDQAAAIDMLLGVGYAMLALAVVIGVLGIANTLALSIVERTRELGLLRAVGMTRGQLRSTVRWESVVIALLGTALGSVLGIGLGAAVVSALRADGIDHLSVPGAQLVVAAALAVAAGILAAVLPARRAARTDVLTAVAAA